MKVVELIAKLRELEPDAEIVYFNDAFSSYHTKFPVTTRKKRFRSANHQGETYPAYLPSQLSFEAYVIGEEDE